MECCNCRKPPYREGTGSGNLRSGWIFRNTATKGQQMAIYLSMQRVRFSSADGYEKFELLFGEVRNQLKTLPGFLHLTWWIHPKDPSRYNECSMWTSLEALRDWHMNMYHKQAKAY